MPLDRETNNWELSLIYWMKKKEVIINKLELFYNVLDMIINCIWYWGFSIRDQKSMEYSILAITPSYTLTWSGSTC